MYPRLSDLFQEYLGFELPFPIYSFGFMVAAAILIGSWLIGREMDRYYRLGLLNSVKLPPKPEKGKKVRAGQLVDTSPSELIGTITIIAAGVGVAGSKLFHIFENFGAFMADPAGMVFSAGGLTFYGGLICATIGVVLYLKKYKLSIPVMTDVFAPALILGYGIGRLGCHLAGDGDWGIAADLASKPSWLPLWLWAEPYPNNILNIDLGVVGVYPTAIYEFVVCVILFAILWRLRKHNFQFGWLASLYLVFNGLERFFIEKIRVNNLFDLFGMQVTQAEVISSIFVLIGVIGLIKFSRRRDDLAEKEPKMQTATT